jgi:hypothetical protein
VSASVQQRQRERLKIEPTIRSVSLGARPCRSKRPVYGDGTRNPFQTQTVSARGTTPACRSKQGHVPVSFYPFRSTLDRGQLEFLPSNLSTILISWILS